MDSHVLRVGDVIALKHAKPNDGWLSAEGLISEELFLSKQTDDFSECLWEIHVQYQYSAVKEYEAMLTSGNLNFDLEEDEDDNSDIPLLDMEENRNLWLPKKTAEAKAIEQLNNLHKAAINEQRLNEKIMSLKVGKAVAYGDLIQLKHVKSKKFLTISQHTLARQEKENMRVLLQNRGDNTSCLLFMPRFKYDREGQHIASNMETFLRVHERPGEYVHAAKKNSYGYTDGRKEINCSLETSAWTVICYQQARDVKARTIMAGQLVTLQDPDSSTFLTLETLVPGVTERSKVVMAPHFQFTADASYDVSVGTQLLWLIEKEMVTVGGSIHILMDRITLRNLNTGLFIRCEPDGLFAVKGRHNATVFEFTSQSGGGRSLLQEDTAVQLSANVGGIGWVCLQKEVAESNELDARGCELQQDRFSAISFLVSASILRTIGVDLYVAHQGALTLREFEALTRVLMTSTDPGVSISIGTQIKSIFTLLDCLNGFLSNEGTGNQEEIDLLLEKNSAETIARRQTMSREQGLIDVVLDIIQLCELGIYDHVKALNRRDTSMMLKQNSSIRSSFTGNDGRKSQKNFDQDNVSSSSLATMSGKGRVSETQRRLSAGSSGGVGMKRGESSKDLLTSGSTNAAMSDVVKSNLRRLSSIDKSKVDDSNGNSSNSSFTMSQELAQSCLKLVLALVKGNHTSQMHIADRFPVILNQVKHQEYAVQCVKEMLKDNLLMLQTKVRQREIDIFVKLLVECEMSVTFLKLLQSTCSCPMGVDNTQRMVTYALFGGKKDSDSDSSDGEKHSDEEEEAKAKPVLMRLHGNTVDSAHRKLDFTLEHSIYMPTDPEQLREVKGRELFETGLPSLYVSWHSDDMDSDFSMIHLFDTNNMVAIDKFCHPVKGPSERQITNGPSKSALYPVTRNLSGQSSPLDESGPNSLNGPPSPMNATNSVIAGSVGSNAVIARNARRRQSQLARTTLVLKRQKVVANKSSSSYDLKVQVLNFFVAQLYLIADLCLDRNYVAINTLESLFPYDSLLALLLTNNIPARIKAPVCRILRCMYVDREPQVAAIFPRLIRTSVTLRGGQENSFQDHHLGSPYSFALLQQVISEYIRTSLTSSKRDEFSAELMDLLQTLINFGFYSTPQQIRDILGPLVHGLDMHKQLRGHVAMKFNQKYGDSSDDGTGPLSRKGSTTMDGMDSRSSTVMRIINSFRYVCKRVAVCCFPRWNRKNNYTESQVVPGNEEDEMESVYVSPFSTLRMIRSMQSRLRSVWSFLRSDSSKAPWQKRWLETTNTMSYLVLILLVVFLSIIVLALELSENFKIAYFEVFVLIFFASELCARIYCFWFVRGKITLFFKDYFNWLDTALVLLDIVLESTGVGSNGARAAQSVRAIRILRFLRLFRILRAARILRKLADKAGTKISRKNPTRYTSISEYEAKSVVSILKILTMIYDRIQDQNLGIFIQAFVIWFDNETKSAASSNYPNNDNNMSMTGTSAMFNSFNNNINTSNANNPNAVGTNGLSGKSPLDVYLETIDKEEDVSSQIPPSFDGVLIDMLMYANSDLVESALNLLMVHKSKNQLLFQAAEKTQIIYSPIVEEKYKFMLSTLRELKRLAEKFEIWGELESIAHVEEGNKMNDMLIQLTNMIKIPCDDATLNIREEFLPDSEVQNLLLNLNAMPCFMIIQETLFDGGREALKPLIATILRACNELICWFVKYSPVNQEVAFQHINWFFERIENDVGSSIVIRTILQGNRNLIKQCPKKFIADCSQKIIANGRKPMYLDMYLGMTEMSRQFDCAVQSVENEISRHLTSREWAHKILLWCVSYNSPQYMERRKDMELLIHRGGTVEDKDMSANLRYHAGLVTLLASCNLGPKLQAIYPFEDVVHTIVDPTCVYPIKKALGLLLLEMMTCGIDGVEYSEELWKFYDNACTELEIIQNSIRTLLKDYQKNVLSRIRTAEWLQIVLKIVVIFFTDFELHNFTENNFDNETNEGVFRATTRTEAVIESTIRRMFHAIKGIYQSYCSQVSPTLKEDMKLACYALARHCPNELKFDPDHDDISRKPAGKPGRRSLLSFATGGPLSVGQESSDATIPRASIVNKNRFLSSHHQHGLHGSNSRHNSTNRRSFTSMSMSISGISMSAFFKDGKNKNSNMGIQEDYAEEPTPITQLQYRIRYQEFTRAVISGFTQDQLNAVQLFESIPTEFDEIESDVRLESLLRKLTSHIRSRLKKTVNHRKLDAGSVNTTRWLLKTFRMMLERTSKNIVVNNRIISQNLPTTNDERTELLRGIYDEYGVTYLCIDLLSVGIDVQVCVEAMELLVIMLLVKGGNRPIQRTIFNYLKETDSVLFFEAIKDIIDNLMVWCQKESEISSGVNRSNLTNPYSALGMQGEDEAMLKRGGLPSSPAAAEGTTMPPEQIVFRLIQLMCDGNYLPAKNLLRDQEGNSRVANIIDSLASFIDKLSRQETPMSTRISIDVIKTMLKLMQGPCKGNQEHLIMHTELLVSLNRLMRTSRPTGQNFTTAWATDIDILREAIVDILLAAIEGQPETSVVFERVATTIELNVYHVVLLPSIDSDIDASVLVELIEDYELTKLQAKYLVFLESLGDMRGTLPTFAQEKIRTDIASVEIVRGEEVNSIFFYIPEIVKDISKTSIQSVTADIDCSAHERKLSEFLHNVSGLYREAKHQQFLRQFGISDLWSLQNRLTWLMFANAVLMNCLILGFYQVHYSYYAADDEHHDTDDHAVDDHSTDDHSTDDHSTDDHSTDDHSTDDHSTDDHSTDDHAVDDHSTDDHAAVDDHHTTDDHAVDDHAVVDDHYTAPHRQMIRQAVRKLGQTVIRKGISRAFSVMSAAAPTDDGGRRSAGHDLYMDPTVDYGIYLLTILQLLLAAAVVAINVIIRMPVRFNAHREKGVDNTIESIFYALADPMPIWYLLYFIFTLLGLFKNHLFLSLLLLDFAVLDPTTRHLLEAVKNPAKQLLATLVIIVIVLNVFAGVVFYFYRDEVVGFDIYSMWESFKLGLSYGIRGEYGVSHEMTNTLGVRMVVDLAFYFIVLAILRHIFFAIIVDTFGQLREDKFERDQHANNSCFICGVHRHDFDRMSVGSSSGGFGYHRSVIHNTSHYLYYIMSIWQSPEEDDNGIEMHVRHCLKSGDISWFPVGSSGHHSHGGKHGAGAGGGSGHMLPGASNAQGATAAGHAKLAREGSIESSHGSGAGGGGSGSNGGSGGGSGGASEHGSGGSGHSSMISRSSSNGPAESELMVNHILHIEQQLNRMIGGESTKLKSDFPLSAISEHEHDEDDGPASKDSGRDAKVAVSAGSIASAPTAVVIDEQQLQKQIQLSLQKEMQQQLALQQQQISSASTLNNSTQRVQLSKLDELSSKIADVGSVLRMVVNRLEKIETGDQRNAKQSSTSGKKKSKEPMNKSKTITSSLMTETGSDSKAAPTLRGPPLQASAAKSGGWIGTGTATLADMKLESGEGK